MTNTGNSLTSQSSVVPSAAMVAMGRRLAEVRLRPDGEAVGWVQRSGGPAELVVASLSTSLPGGSELTVGPHTVVAMLPPIVAPHPSGGGAWCWLPDGSAVVYAGRTSLCLALADGGPIRTIVRAGEGRQLWSPVVDPNGTLLAYIDEGESDAFIAVTALSSLAAGADGAASTGPLRVSLPEDRAFVLDPEWGADGLLAWHAWAVPAMPWDHSRVDMAHIVCVPREDTHGSTGLAVTARGAITGGRLGQPRWCGSRLSWIDDASGFAVVTTGHVRIDGDTLVVDGVCSITDTAEHSGPTWGPGQRTTAWSLDGSSVAFERNEAGFGRLCVAVPGAVQTGDAFSGRPIGRGVHGSLSWAVTADGDERLAAVRQGATTPGQVVVYDRPGNLSSLAKSGGGENPWRRTIVARSAVAGWERVALVEPIEVAAPAADGTMIPGRLYRPEVAGGDRITGPLPTIVAIHGGPTDQTRVEWNPRFAAYLAAGWQVLVVDHRGSTGWGRAHQQAMNEQWGVLDVSDTVALLLSLIVSGRVDPATVVASGGSAGGFTVLSLLIAHPDLFAGGIALYPVTDLIALDASTHRFEAHYQRILIGARPQHERRYTDRSPLHGAARIRVPLLLFHGTDDKVVDVAQSDALAALLAGNGEYVRFEGEGHGWNKPETTAAEHEKVMEFLGSIRF